MASGKLLRLLVQSGKKGDQSTFAYAAEQLIKEERDKQHHLLANDLEKILYGVLPIPNTNGLLHLFQKVPVDKERGLPLITLRLPQRGLEELVINEKISTSLEDILEEHRRSDILKTYGVRPANRILFFGPPGCGKTLTAEVLAYELDRPLAIIQLDAVVSSFLGETAANLRKVFDFISEHSLVAVFDEFDAIGKQRADSAEHGELRRVVNAVLQMLDAYEGNSIIVAATNHEQILDVAIWRRFDELIQFSHPTKEQLIKFLQLKLRGVRREFEVDDRSQILKIFSTLSLAVIDRIIRRTIKKMILKNKEFVGIRDFEVAKEKEKTTYISGKE